MNWSRAQEVSETNKWYDDQVEWEGLSQSQRVKCGL